MRTILASVCLVTLVGCGGLDFTTHHRRRHDRDWDYDHRHRPHHYRLADDQDEKNALEDGTPIPEDLKNPPQVQAEPAKPSQVETLLSKISDQLAQQPTTMHHEFEAMRQSMSTMQTSVDQKLAAVPERIKSSVMSALDQPPPQPKSEAKPPVVGIRDPLDDEPSGRGKPYGNYNGLVAHLDLSGTSKNSDGTLSGGDCPACVSFYNHFIHVYGSHGWKIGYGSSNHVWLKPVQRRPGVLDPTFEMVRDGIVTFGPVHGFTPEQFDRLMEEHPFKQKTSLSQNRGFPPDAPPSGDRSQADEWERWRNRDQGQSNCSRPQYAQSNCSQPVSTTYTLPSWSNPAPNVYAVPNCSGGYSYSQPNYGYQSMPLQTFGIGGGRIICTSTGCYTLPY